MQAMTGDKVRVHYVLKDTHGETVESTYDSGPIEFVIGEGKVIPGFEKAVAGMSPAEKKSLLMPPDDGYGKHDQTKVFEFPRQKAPGDFDPQIGQTVHMHRPDGKTVLVTVVARTENGFMMDSNHPLAGKELSFELELVEIVKEDGG